jgi:hypothetical protein
VGESIFASPDSVVFSASMTRDGRKDASGLDALRWRATNRKHGDAEPLDSRAADELRRAANEAGGELVLVTERQRLTALGELLGRADQAALLSRAHHRALFAEIRWSPEEVVATRTGIDLTSLELTPTDASALRVLAQWSTLELVRDWDAGRALRKSARQSIASSSAVALVRRRGEGRSAYFDGGMIVERVWHRAAELGLAVQPWSALLFLFEEVRRGGPAFQDARMRHALEALERDFRATFPPVSGVTDVFLVRISHARPPTSLSLRKPPHEILVDGPTSDA